MVTGNRRDREMDIVLMSSKDGSIIRNLTSGFDQDRGFEFIIHAGHAVQHGAVALVVAIRATAIGYFVRAEKWRTLILQNVLNGDIEERVELRTIDDPESPDISPDGRKVAFAGAAGRRRRHLRRRSGRRAQVTNLTKDGFADSGPTWSPDGQSIVYVARVSGNEKLFRLDVATGQKTQLTFGTHDDSAAQFLDADTLVFSSTATDPASRSTPEVARNGNIYNIWTLEPEDRRAAAVHRRARRQHVGGRAEHGSSRAANRLRQLLQGRIRAAHARAAATRSPPRPAPTSARPDRSSTSRRRSRTP